MVFKSNPFLSVYLKDVIDCFNVVDCVTGNTLTIKQLNLIVNNMTVPYKLIY
jgi:hypothetical protein